MKEINDGFNNEARFCEQCEKIVYLVTTNSEIALHLEYNDCIAIHDDIKQDYFQPRVIYLWNFYNEIIKDEMHRFVFLK